MAFVSTWSVANGDVVTLPISPSTCTVTWRVGEAPENFVNDIPTHTYSVAGGVREIVTITVIGELNDWSFDIIPDSRDYLVSIDSYGSLSLEATGGYNFNRCTRLVSLPSSGSYNLGGNTCDSMFSGCTMLQNGLQTLNVSNVTTMSYIFFNCINFNGSDITSWNVQKVKYMDNMFRGCTVFNGYIGDWDVREVINMTDIFRGCTSFRQDVSKWNLSSITSNDFAPAFTDAYLSQVKPKFSSQFPTGWKFNPPVTADVLNVIIPVASRPFYYIDDNLRLMRIYEPPAPTEDETKGNFISSKLSASVISTSSNSAIMDYI
jgi:surface protein